MKNKWFGILLLFIAILFSNTILSGCSKGQSNTKLYTRVDNYVFFGEYPQSLKKNDVKIIKFSEKLGYYIGSDGKKYCENQGEYYKVEPLKWRIVNEADGKALIVCDYVIDASVFQGKCWFDISRYYAGSPNDRTYYANDYRASNLKQFMHDNIFKTAFTKDQQSKISATYLEDVEAEVRVFALSYEELQFIGNDALDGEEPIIKKDCVFYASDYAVSRGVTIANRDELISQGCPEEYLDICDGAALFSLRTATYVSSHTYGDYIYTSFAGVIETSRINSLFGVLPALYLTL